MANDQDGPASFLLGYFVERCDDSAFELKEGLRTRDSIVYLVSSPLLPKAFGCRVAVVPKPSLHNPVVNLLQGLSGLDGQPMSGCRGFGRFYGSPQGVGIDGRKFFMVEHLHQAMGLLASFCR